MNIVPTFLFWLICTGTSFIISTAILYCNDIVIAMHLSMACGLDLNSFKIPHNHSSVLSLSDNMDISRQAFLVIATFVYFAGINLH